METITQKLYLQVLSEITKNNEILITIESYITLFIYKYLNSPNNTLIYLINSEHNYKNKKTDKQNAILIKLLNVNCIFLNDENDDGVCKNISANEKLFKNCKLPVLILMETNTIIAGLCGVCRGLIKSVLLIHKDVKIEQLLGFKNGCLMAPAETSMWTKFCEIDIINCIKNSVELSIKLNCCENDGGSKNDGNDDKINIIQLPVAVMKFEKHMSQPIRIHNVYKLARNLANQKDSKTNQEILNTATNILSNENSNETENNVIEKLPRENKIRKSKLKKNQIQIASNLPISELNLDHIYVEGQQITLADLILYSSFKIIINLLTNELDENIQILTNLLPLTFKWITNLDIIDNGKLLNSFNCFKSINNNDNMTLLKKNIKYNLNTEKLVENFTLYKMDVKRNKSNNRRLFTRQIDIDHSLLKISKLNINISSDEVEVDNENILKNFTIKDNFDWSKLPFEILPEGGGDLPLTRYVRKKHQLENLIKICLSIARPNDCIVDFCCGTGHLGIILAYLLPNCTVILLENKEESLMRARKRIEKLHLKNIFYYQCNLDYFIGNFDIGLSLHACGIATDIVLQLCLNRHAKFICCPCCYGNIHYKMEHIEYPRSFLFRNNNLTYDDYLHIAHCADQAHDIVGKNQINMNLIKCKQGQYCMDIIDTDRKLLAEQYGYKVILTRLQPENCTPKNRLLIGVF